MTPGSRAIGSLDELEAFAQELARAAAPRQILLLSGPMGVGKTALAQAIARALGADLETASPTFAIHHRYESTRGPIDHFDLYRLEGDDDLESTGFWDLLTGPAPRLALIEWPERLNEKDLPTSWSRLRVEMAFGDEGGDARAIRVSAL